MLRRLLFGLLVATLSFSGSLKAADTTCTHNFELSVECIRVLGLSGQVATYERHIAKAQYLYGTSYLIRLRVVGSTIFMAEIPNSDVWTDVVRNAQMHNESFVINVSVWFLQRQPEILLEHSSRHEVAHIMNDDLTGYHHQEGNIELAEERRVLDLVGEERYREYIRAYTAYKSPPRGLSEDAFVARVRSITLVAAPSDIDEADTAASAYFKSNKDGNEHLLVWDGQMHDISLVGTPTRVTHDPTKLTDLTKSGRPLVFFHNHPDDYAINMFPSGPDYAAAAYFTSIIWKENPQTRLEFRVMVPRATGTTSVSYGLKGEVVTELRQLSGDQLLLFADLIGFRSFWQYLRYACPVNLSRPDAEVCTTHPQYFLWPSDSFFLNYRGVTNTP